MSYIGMHRAEVPPLRERLIELWAFLGPDRAEGWRYTRERLAHRGRAVLDWLRLAWANLTAPRPQRPAQRGPERGIGGYPVCDTCRFGQHRGCGLLDGDPPCGCKCFAAGMGRRAHEDRQVVAL